MSPRALYRTYLQHLRQIPDPHVWNMLAPHFRVLVGEAHAPVTAESSSAARVRQEHAFAQVRKQTRRLEAAIAYHPHALFRLLEQCYGQRGRVKWQLVKRVTLSTPVPREDWPPIALAGDTDPEPRYPPATYQPIPAPLVPLARVMPVLPSSPRARTIIPEAAKRRAAKNAWKFSWTRVRVPLVLPPGRHESRTGWEGTGVVEGLLQLAAVGEAFLPPPPRKSGLEHVEPKREPLPTLKNLPPSLRACFPKRPVPPADVDYPRPRPAHTRKNPKTWRHPREFTPRALRRAYRRLWESLPWVRQTAEGRWVQCTFAQLNKQEKTPYVLAKVTEEEMKWLDGL